MYPENPEGTQVIVGSMNMGYISNTARNQTRNLFRPKHEPIPLGHSDGQVFLRVRIGCVGEPEISSNFLFHLTLQHTRSYISPNPFPRVYISKFIPGGIEIARLASCLLQGTLPWSRDRYISQHPGRLWITWSTTTPPNNSSDGYNIRSFQTRHFTLHSTTVLSWKFPDLT